MTNRIDPDLVRRALANFIELAPAPAPWPLRRISPSHTGHRPRWVVPVAASAVGVAGIGGALVVGGQRSEAPGSVPVASVDTVGTSTLPVGDMACGDHLPAFVEATRSSGPLPGAATAPAAVPGQYVEHWELDNGTIEFRWPADPAPRYTLPDDPARESEWPPLSSEVPPYTVSFSSGVGDEGVYWLGLTPYTPPQSSDSTPDSVAAGPSLDGASFGLDPQMVYAAVIGWTPTDPTVQDEPCDVLQVRFIDDAGEISTWGYPLTEVNETGFGGWTPRQLGPLVVAIGQAVDPPPVYEDDNCDATSGEPFGARTTTRASSERSSPWSETATAGPSPRGKSPAADRELNHPW